MQLKSVLDVLDKLKSSTALKEVKLLHMRGTAAKESQVTFAISFVFLGAE